MESSHIATSGRAHTARPALDLLGLAADTPMITRDMVAHAKPDPDLFLAAAALLDVEPRRTCWPPAAPSPSASA
jgi:beta-phosphoglucomutase-like phosphatase (HAD superfamily)